MIDPVFRIVPPPVDAALTAVDMVISNRIITINCVIIIAAAIYALRLCKQSGSPIPILLLVGGAFTNLAEPFVDLGGACWHPIIGQDAIFENMDRPMPLWLLTTYIAYFGMLPMLIYHSFSKGATTRTMWMWFLIPVIVDIVLEEALLSQSDHLYLYYANQPLRLHTFPIWWTTSNTIGVFLSGVVMTIFAPLLRGWRLMLVPLCTLLCYVGATGFVAWPSIVVINSEFSNAVTQLGGIASFLIAFLTVHVCALLIASDSPHNVRRAFSRSTE
jgi:hypothetical protein